ncbi:Acyl-CoA N-acyltransferase [Penicillium maclennaniae]|uniref:Acyl-CoA N-acyltransferase n=1 Tax=Penicillium maclennaniae TaxID=1343394 RepID=UPI0025419470|nr:Acyl-CoA N-acyltransferase [Penicillium maclennaniae]KAJ5668400.1 Acyl-CoA N-acyltransferase [Penicillium maclennaniae]
MTITQIHEHDATSILPILASHLPHSITCLRRIQHGVAYPSPTAKILATFPSSATPDPGTPWLAARVDLFLGRQTQIVLYSSLESRTSLPPIAPATQSDGSPDPVISTFDAAPAELDLARDQLLAMMRHVKCNLLPEYLASLSLSEPGPEPGSGSGSGSGAQSAAEEKTKILRTINSLPLIPPPSPKAFLFGAIPSALFVLLMRDRIFVDANGQANPGPGLRIHRFDNPPYFTYLFSRAVFGAMDTSTLPDGYRYHDRKGRVGVLPEHLDLQRWFRGGGKKMPIAWGFLGVDGAVATLNVEPEHRGKGLAVALSKKVMKEGIVPGGAFGAERSDIQDEVLRDKLGEWVHTEVAQSNKASRRVMEKIGGEVMATVMWTAIELLD